MLGRKAVEFWTDPRGGAHARGMLWRTAGLNRLISTDPATGRLVCEAGVVLRDIQKLMIPRGWSLAVVPGTQPPIPTCQPSLLIAIPA